MRQPDDAFKNPLGFQPGIDPDPVSNDEIFKAQLKEMFDLNMAVYQVFKTPHGKKVLAWLRKATIESAAWMPSIAREHGIEAANAHAYAREGQNALVRDIENRMDVASKCKSPEDLMNFVNQGSKTL